MASLRACVLHSAVTGSIANPTRKWARTAIPYVTRDGSHRAWTSHGESSGCCSFSSIPLNQQTAQWGSQCGPDPALGAAPPVPHSTRHPRCPWTESGFQTPVLPLGKTGKYTQSHGLPRFSRFQCQGQTMRVSCENQQLEALRYERTVCLALFSKWT